MQSFFCILQNFCDMQAKLQAEILVNSYRLQISAKSVRPPRSVREGRAWLSGDDPAGLLIALLLGELIEYDDTQKLFYQPKEKRTEDYITGRFG